MCVYSLVWNGKNFGDEYICKIFNVYMKKNFPSIELYRVGDVRLVQEQLENADATFVLPGGGWWGASGTGCFEAKTYTVLSMAKADMFFLNIGIESHNREFDYQMHDIVSKSRLFALRDPYSHKMATQVVGHNEKVIWGSDTAFLYDVDTSKRHVVDDLIGVNLCGSETENNINSWDTNIIAEEINKIPIPKEGFCCAYSQDVPDYPHVRKVDRDCGERYDLATFKRSRYFIGMHFHSIIVALLYEIPLLAINSSDKVKRVMHEYELDDYLISPNNPREIVDKFALLMKNEPEVVNRIREKNVRSKERCRHVFEEYGKAISAKYGIDNRMKIKRQKAAIITTGEGGVEASRIGKSGDSLMMSGADDGNLVCALENRSRVSIVLPTYNQLHFLPSTLHSILSQSLSDFELIVVNDGSTDGTREYLDGMKDHRIRVIHQKNMRLPGALNTGFQEARGKYLTWVSSDNFCAPYFLEALVGALDTELRAGLAYGDFFLVDNKGNLLKSLLIRNDGNAAFLYRRECMEKIGLYDTELEGAEDWDYWIRIAEHFDFVHVPDTLYYYRLHNDSMQNTMKRKVDEAAHKTLEKAIARKGGQLGLSELYPAIAVCKDREEALFVAAYDFGTNLLRARVASWDMAAVFLKMSIEYKPNFLPTYVNLAIAYAYSGKWNKALQTIEKVGKVKGDLTKMVDNLRDACRIKSRQALKKFPTISINKQSTELFQREKELRIVYPFTVRIGE
ncbi:MAG: glycosyltransferase [Deltaproteobacteria bacterium]|nr:glycosyltransferase [Deltaproteobacteria bacterium]